MTRATLLHVLDRPTALGPAEVRELEQLAQAFPYCQTAHLLLAKAAHDQGTMLAGQRLRRAATYAADRTLLRRLIEQVEPVAAEVTAAEEPAAVLPQPTPAATPVVPEHSPIAEAPAAIVATVLPVAAPVAEVPPAAPVVSLPVVAVSAAEPVAVAAAPESVIPVYEPAPAMAEVAATVPEPIAGVPSIAIESATDVVVAPEAVPAAVEPPVPEGAGLALLLDQEGTFIPTSEPQPEVIELPEATLESTPLEATPAAEEPDLPAQAPAIRPPVEVGEARFEFGLAEPPPPAVPTYELPGLIDEWAASAVTRSMGKPAASTESLAPTPAPVVFTPAAFTGDATIGYAFGESSRLGFSMQLLDLLAAQAHAAECVAAPVAAAQPPAGPLPPTGAFFEPDLLLLDHWATHCPPIPVLPSSLDLINNFLKRQPRLTRPAMLPPTAGTQADLSVRSTRAEPDLVSENLARIFVRQGKTARAIEIYEKLMVKQPEKMAYFATQIQQLQPPA